MTAEILSLVLWIPFGILAFIYGLIFCIRGYKKGLYRALISLVATLLACLISVLLARLISPSLAEKAAEMIPAEEYADFGIFASFMPTIIKGVMQNVVAMVLFSSFLFVLSIIFKAIASSIKKDKLLPTNTGMRWGGLGVRLLDAFLVCILLMLPVYGTMAVYVPVIDKSLSVMPTEDADMLEAKEYMGAVSKHPLVKVSASKHVAAVYNGLAEIKADEGSINIPKMVSTAEKFVSMVTQMEGKSESEQLAAAGEIVSFMRSEVVNQKWFYEAYKAVKSEAVKVVDEFKVELTAEEQQFVDEIMSTLDFSETELRELADAGLGLMEYILADGTIYRMEEQGASYMYGDNELLSRFGKLLNYNEGAVRLKKVMIFGYLTNLFDGMDQAKAFLEANPVTKKDDVSLQKKEAEAVFALMASDDKLEVIEGLARNPDFGFELMKGYVTKELIIEEFIYFTDSQLIENYIAENPAFISELTDELKRRVESNVTEESLDDFVLTKLADALGISFGSSAVLGEDFVVSFDGENYTYEDGSGLIINKESIVTNPDGSVYYYFGNGSVTVE